MRTPGPRWITGTLVSSAMQSITSGGPAPSCEQTANTNGDGVLDISDPIGLLAFLYLGDRAPADPFRACGIGEPEDKPNCASYAPCE